MKCIILAGGAGDRLWPLSRKNYPKQFINMKGDNSLFQETITRNIPYCDEFLIVTNLSYKSIVESQMQRFQGLSYRVVYEEQGMGTGPAIAVAVHMIDEEETLLILPADAYITGTGYSEAIYEAKELAGKGETVLFGARPSFPSVEYGYIRASEGNVVRFISKASQELANQIFSQNDTFWNCGLLLALGKNLRFLLKKYMPDVEKWCKEMGHLASHDVTLSKQNLGRIKPCSIEKEVLEKCNNLSMVQFHCDWRDIGSLESYYNVCSQINIGNCIIENSTNTFVINDTEDQLVVTDGVDSIAVVNTEDAIYVFNRNKENHLKDIVSTERKQACMDRFFEDSNINYRQWGYRKIISQGDGFRTRKVVIYPGGTISNHAHANRTEMYSVVKGMLSLELEDRILRYGIGEGVTVTPGQMHRLFNESDEDVIVIEVDTGIKIDEKDMLFTEDMDMKKAIPSLYKMKPAFKDYLWGGHRLVEQFHKESPYDITAESWELSAHSAGQSTIDGGVLDGTPFGDFVAQYGREVCGWKSAVFDRFPILIKFIDAAGPLSVQIHPNDDYAFIHENEFGKNEMWYVMDAEPDAFLYCGFNCKVTRGEVEKRIYNNTITEVLNKVYVKKGDCVFIPAGTIHAIGQGILICEIQQNSNSTYRVYDYDRRDTNGNARELHVEKALDVMNFDIYHQGAYGLEKPEKYMLSEGNIITQLLCQCKYFQCKKYELNGEHMIYVDDSSFVSLIFLVGEATINSGDEKMRVKEGDTIFISSGRRVVHVGGECVFLEVRI